MRLHLEKVHHYMKDELQKEVGNSRINQGILVYSGIRKTDRIGVKGRGCGRREDVKSLDQNSMKTVVGGGKRGNTACGYESDVEGSQLDEMG